jgi:integrase
VARLRTTFVSLMSHQGVAIEEIARLAGHATTRTTEIVYRRELMPVLVQLRRDRRPGPDLTAGGQRRHRALVRLSAGAGP